MFFFSPPLYLKVPSAEARELWKGFIYSVTEVCVVKSLVLFSVFKMTYL